MKLINYWHLYTHSAPTASWAGAAWCWCQEGDLGVEIQGNATSEVFFVKVSNLIAAE